MQSVYEAAGGSEGLLRLAEAWHSRVMADEVVSHAFSHGFHPQHSERLAAYWAEALGGPTTYSDTYADETSVVRIHSGNGPHEEMDRRAIAFDLAVEIDDAHYLLKTGYEEALRSFAPGVLLRHEMILRCTESGCTSYEFLGEDVPWKREWTHTWRDRLQLHAFHTTAPGRIDWLLAARARPLARRARDRLAR